MNIETIIEFATNHPILIGAFVFSLGLIIYAQLKRSSGNNVTSSELVRLINQEDAQVVDLREEKSYKSGHILDSKNILPAKVTDDFATLKLKLNKPVVLVCQMGSTSSAQVKTFLEQGCEKVYSLQDGIYGWEKSKLPLEQ